MATYIDRAPRERQGPLFDRALVFQRGDRGRALCQNRRRRTLRLKHVMALLVIQAALFVTLGKAYLFLASWDKLKITKVEITGARPSLFRDLDQFFRARPLGNILFCDLKPLYRQLGAFAWVKSVQIQKVHGFPAMLKVAVEPRVPFARVQKGELVLVDQDAVELERINGEEWSDLPIISGETPSAAVSPEEWPAVRDCLKSIPVTERSRLAALECAEDGRIMLSFKDDAVRLILDGGTAFDRIQFFVSHRADWESRFGLLDTVDLRFDDRVIVRPVEQAANSLSSHPPKESD